MTPMGLLWVRVAVGKGAMVQVVEPGSRRRLLGVQDELAEANGTKWGNLQEVGN